MLPCVKLDGQQPIRRGRGEDVAVETQMDGRDAVAWHQEKCPSYQVNKESSLPTPHKPRSNLRP